MRKGSYPKGSGRAGGATAIRSRTRDPAAALSWSPGMGPRPDEIPHETSEEAMQTFTERHAAQKRAERHNATMLWYASMVYWFGTGALGVFKLLVH